MKTKRKEKRIKLGERKISRARKIILAIVGVIIFIIALFCVLSAVSFSADRRPILGVTFSSKFSEYLGLDWKENYLALIKDLKIKHLRLSTYWLDVEPKPGEFDFKDTDWQLEVARDNDAKVVLVVGMRQPRWPECHMPAWVEQYSAKDRAERILNLVRTTVERYKYNVAIEAWQVENEPLLTSFGVCPPPDVDLLAKEVALVKSIDPTREVMVTASGELSTWHKEATLGDILGTTMYRTVWDNRFGYWNYWFMPASFYRVKAFIQGINLNKWWVAELQMEPWFPNGDLTIPLKEQYKSMSPERITENLIYAIHSNPARIYVWGGEWWYYTKIKLGTEDVWNAVKAISW